MNGVKWLAKKSYYIHQFAEIDIGPNGLDCVELENCSIIFIVIHGNAHTRALCLLKSTKLFFIGFVSYFTGK